jgi:hypothetical protein
MKRWRLFFAPGVALVLAAPVRADLTNTFSTDPLQDSSVQVQGPDQANVHSRFTYNGANGTLTAHYDSALPTIKLVSPLNGQHYTQDTSFTMSATFKVLPGGVVPADFGASAPAFGMINSATTGNLRNSTGYYDSSFNFVEVTPGTAYDLMTFDYYPTLDPTYGGSSLSLTTIHSAQNGVLFSDTGNYSWGYLNATLPTDQFITTTLAYDAGTRRATMDWGSGSVSADLTGAAFNVDSFGITLWQDTNLAPSAPAVGAGSRVAMDVEFDSFSVTATPEPGSLAILACGAVVLTRRRVRRRAIARGLGLLG